MRRAVASPLTPHQFHEHDEHIRYFTEHFVKKGAEAADAVEATMRLHDTIMR